MFGFGCPRSRSLTPKKIIHKGQGGLTSKKSIRTKNPHTDGLRVFINFIEYTSKEKLTQLKSIRITNEKFHAKSLREPIRGTFTLKELGNMDQTSLSFVMDGRTYEKTGADKV